MRQMRANTLFFIISLAKRLEIMGIKVSYSFKLIRLYVAAVDGFFEQ
ncbi:hypothetical protein VIBNIAM115_190033 [Vibrio nigripulchritudo AM115]|nr:hypothetical protein VIBNIAM115_190033 [Vibrio nigripulchritudo AM115]